MTRIEVVAEARAVVGESPVWDDRRGVLWWIDVLANRLYRFDPSTGENRPTELEQHPGAVVLTETDSLLAAVRDGFATLDPDTGSIDVIAPVNQDDDSMRMNDAKCDSAGRMWAGSMAFNAGRNAGTLYRFDPDRTLTPVVPGVTISNGIDWSLDGRTMYYVDSTTLGVDAFDFDPATGDISNRRRLADVTEGLPDGMTVDSEGFLWVAVFGGSCVKRISPDGHTDSVLELPVTQVTSCAFGGPGYGDLYVTSATYLLSDEGLASQPQAGALFRCSPGVKGRAPNRFGGYQANASGA